MPIGTKPNTGRPTQGPPPAPIKPKQSMTKLIYIRDESELLDLLKSGHKIMCATHLTQGHIIGPPGVGYLVEVPEKPKPK